MSSSVKRLLRSARECLGRREYREALQHCKEVLAEDKNCYEAYIYVGKAAFHLQEHTQAEAAYRRASDLYPHNPLAWQGLAELFSETGSWGATADCYAHLLQLADAAGPDDPLRSRRSVFLRRFAEAASRGGLLADAEAAWRALVDAASEVAETTAATAAAAAAETSRGGEGGGGGESEGEAGGAAAASASAAEAELLECLCRLADVQLAADAADIEARVALRLAAEAAGAAVTSPDQAAALESAVRASVEGEWAEEALELDADHASATLRRIIALRPPCPPFVPYYDAFLKRLRKYIQAAPPGSMDRHSRRAVLLAAAKATMEGRCGERAGGCCGPYPYEAALAMLEVEHEVVGAEDPSLDVLAAAASPGSLGPSREPPPLPLMVADCGRIASRLMHRFPWNPTAQLHNALSLRRRAATAGFDVATAGTVVVHLPATSAAGSAAGTGVDGRRHQVTALLLSALSRGGRAVSGWLAACELLLEEGAAEAALDAAKEGLKYVAHRDLVGKERLGGAGLLLRLLAGQALLRLRKLEEAQLLLEGLAHGVSEGHVASGELAGIPPINVSQHAKRYLAHIAAARGDYPSCRQRYDELVGGQLMGRSAAPIEAWAHGELGMLLLRQGGATVEGARFHLQAALAALQPALEAAAASATSPAATTLVALQHEAAAYELHLSLALWMKGGGCLPSYGSGSAAAAAGGGGLTAPTQEPFRTECRELLLGAAAVAGSLQAAAFAWLGHWYGRAAAPPDDVSARRCYQRALALDPTQADAGEALVAALVSAGRSETARLLCQEMNNRITVAIAAATTTGPGRSEPVVHALGAPSPFLMFPGLLPATGLSAAAAAAAGSGRAGWALRCLARLQRDAGASEAAVTSYQTAIRRDPEDAELWEGLGASYQALGRHTAALKSYGRALELAPRRLFSRLQAAALQYQMGNMPVALSYYRTALVAAPTNAAGLLGCGEVLLAQAALAARMGAAGAAAAELAEATALTCTATRLYGNLQAGWKLLGDVRMQHAAVPTLESVAKTRGAVTAASPATGVAPSGPVVPVVVLGRGVTGTGGLQGGGGSAVVDAGLAAARERLAALRSARRAYAAAVHLDPRVAGLWGDLGMSYHLQLELAGQHPQLEREEREDPTVLRRRALALARGGLRLAPASDWLWGCAGTIAAAAAAAATSSSGVAVSAAAAAAEGPAMAAAAEYCFSRALQLNPRRAPVWAALGRLYAAHGEGGLASRCFDFARSHEPTSIAVWEAMGDAALRRGSSGLTDGAAGTDPRVSAAWRDAADAYEHAQLLGGDVESRLGYVSGRLLVAATASAVASATASEGSVLAAATKAAAMQPLMPAAHHARGLALEARGDYVAAVQAHQAALKLLESADGPQPSSALTALPSSHGASASLAARPLATPFDPRVAPTARAAVQLDLARALAAEGRAGEAVVMYDRLRQEGLVRQDDHGARLSYGMALLQVNRTPEALSHLSDVLGSAPAPAKLRLTAAAAVVRIHVAARRWDEAYGTVLAATSDVPDSEGPPATTMAPRAAAGATGGGDVIEAAAKLWLILLAGLVAVRAPELELELLSAARQWAVGRKDLDTAQFKCRIHELLCAKHRAAGTATAALRQAARAVHACPYDRSARSLLAHTAVLAGPRHAAAAARAAPRERPPHAAAAAGENAAPSLAAPPTVAPLAPSAAAVHAVGMAASAAAAAAGTAGVAGGLLAAVREAAARLRRVVHAQPSGAAAWYLCALTELQHAIASGGQARVFRSAATAARAAAARAKAELQMLPAEPPAAAAAAGGPPPRPPMAPPGMPPVLAAAMAAQAARTQAAASDPRVAALRVQRAVLADVAVRSLAVLSECHLQLRGRVGGGGDEGEVTKAREAAEEALRLAGSHGMDSSPAHRQLARLSVVQGDMVAAEAAYEQAARAAAAAATPSLPGGNSSISYELLPVIEWAAVRAATGRSAEAVQQLSTAAAAAAAAGQAASLSPSSSKAALTDVAAVQRALLLLQLGEVEAARAVAAEAATTLGLSGPAAAVSIGLAPAAAGLRSAAHAVQAAAALVQASLAAAAEGDGGGVTAAARKKSLLEARWAAREALKPLSVSQPAGPVGHRLTGRAATATAPPPGPSGPGGALAALLLGLAESGLGKGEGVREQMEQATRLWPHTATQPPESFAAALTPGGPGTGASGGGGGGNRCHVARAVHCRPWALGEAWSNMVSVVRAR